MIFTVRFRDDHGIPLEGVLGEDSWKSLLKGKQCFYVLSTALDGAGVTKFGICHDASRRGWNISRLRKYVTHYGTSTHGACHGVKLHFLATTTYEASDSKMVADRYRKSTLVRLEAQLKKFYASSDVSMKSEGRGDERVRVAPIDVVRKVLEYKTKMPNQVTPNPNRRVLPRRAKRKAKVTLRKAKPNKRTRTNNNARTKARTKAKTKTPKKWQVAKFVGTRPYEVKVKWKGFSKATWEPKANMRRDLGSTVMDKMLEALGKAKK